jgi:hypothetical protein
LENGDSETASYSRRDERRGVFGCMEDEVATYGPIPRMVFEPGATWVLPLREISHSHSHGRWTVDGGRREVVVVVVCE